MRPAAQLVGVAALVVAGIKWLRVVQREHYLPGSVLTMYLLWARSSPLNLALGALPFLAAVMSVTLQQPTLALVIGSVGLAVFPVGLSVRGRSSKLAWTSRLWRLAILGTVLTIMAALLFQEVEGLLTRGRGDAMLLNVLTIAAFIGLLEVAVRVTEPLERRLSQPFVDEASKTLARIKPIVVGVTGSYGKTSTKGYVRDLVDGTLRVVASPASFNNRMGLSRAVNEHLPGDAQVFIAEMGTYGPGEIADLCRWLPPNIAVITAIGPVHLERFKTEANIVAAKSEILEPASMVVLNVDHPALRELADRITDKTIWRCGIGEQATDVRVRPGDEGGLDLIVQGTSIGMVKTPGIFAANLACAIAVALELGVDPALIVTRSEGLESPPHRQTVSVGSSGFTIIDDTFNANPAGAARALVVLAAHGGPEARRVVVTPGMVELGSRQVDENVLFAAAAAAVADDVVVVGNTNRRALKEGTSSGSASVIVVRARRQAVEWVRSNLGPGDVVLYENDLPDHYP